MSLARVAWLAQLGTTLPLVGLIWFVQIVAYPLFALVGPSEFARYHEAHSRLISFVVAPLMVAELGAALFWLVDPGDFATRAQAAVGALLVALAWLVTVFVSVPRHAVLAQGFDARAHAVLLSTNWLRTFAWSARGALLVLLTAKRG